MFLDFPLPNGGRYEAWENYDFFIHRPGTNDEPYQMAWQRYGAPRRRLRARGRQSITLLSWRVDSNAGLPKRLREWAEKEKPMWLNPPRDLDEIPRAPSRARRWRAGRADCAGRGACSMIQIKDALHNP